jgi:UPF0755 protein
MITGEDVERSESGGRSRRRRPRRIRRRRGRFTAVIVGVVLVPFLVLGSGVTWFLWELDTHGKPGHEIAVQIQSGWGVPRIGEELTRDHVIGSSLVFNIYARFNGDNRFQAGTYDLHTGLGVRDAVAALKRGPRINYQVLKITPGLWLQQIATRVGRLRPRSATVFLQATRNNSVRSQFEPEGVTNLEGLVRPDTYKISNSQDEIAILQTLVRTFDTRAKRLGLATANVEGHTAYQIIIVASMIEAEAKVPQDRPLIASVIYNRLRQNMKLQIDSTVIYARGKPADRKLTPNDLDTIASPYNTYLHAGLPPTPIGSVSDASLLAAMNPAHTTFIYYVLGGKDGHHVFATTPEQQQQNIDAAKKAGVL